MTRRKGVPEPHDDETRELSARDPGQSWMTIPHEPPDIRPSRTSSDELAEQLLGQILSNRQVRAMLEADED